MERLDGQDELITRIADADPARGVAPLSDGALERVARTAMTPERTPWSWTKFRFATLGAGAASGVLVVAGILGLQAAVPSLPVLALGAPSSAGRLGATGENTPSASSGNEMMIPALRYDFTISPSLSPTTGPGTAYQLVSSESAQAAATQLATAFDLAGPVTSPSDGDFQVGSDAGPYVSTWTSGGVVNWSYVSAESTATSSPPTTSSSTPPASGSSLAGPLPTDAQASAQALALLASAGITTDLGTPAVDDSDPMQVAVTVPMVVDGQATDQSYSVDYGPDGTIGSASGILAGRVEGATYPTISASDAVSVLHGERNITKQGCGTELFGHGLRVENRWHLF